MGLHINKTIFDYLMPEYWPLSPVLLGRISPFSVRQKVPIRPEFAPSLLWNITLLLHFAHIRWFPISVFVFTLTIDCTRKSRNWTNDTNRIRYAAPRIRRNSLPFWSSTNSLHNKIPLRTASSPAYEYFNIVSAHTFLVRAEYDNIII